MGGRGLIMNDVKATKLEAILAINPSAKFVIRGTEPVEWLEGTTPISDSDIDAKVTELTTKNAHILPRSKAYPDLKEQLDSLYKDIVAGTVTTSGAFATAIKAVKDAHPKS